MPPTKSTGTLIAEWVHNTIPHRLVAIGRHSAGYEDSYVIERQEADAPGAPHWVTVVGWIPNEDDRATLLVAALKHKVNARL